MANKFITGNSFSTGDQVTAAKLNASINSATFDTGAVDDTTTGISSGAIIVKDAGITPAKISTGGPSWDSSGNVSVSGVVSVPDGSESVPSITNTGDTNTGIYFPAENSVALTAGAGATLTSTNTAITIDVPTSIVSTAQSDLTLQGGDSNSKNLIFKKASAQQGKITAVGDELKFYAGTSATETLELTTTEAVVTGNLGIGTSPAEKLEVAGNAMLDASNANLKIKQGTIGTTGGVYFTLGTDSTLYAGVEFVYDDRQAVGPRFYSENGYDLTVDSGDDLHIQTDSTDRITVLNGGNVGIGTSSPDEELHISASVPKIQIQDSDGTDQYGQFYHSAGVTAIQARNNTSDGTIVFQKYDGTTTDETVRIDSAGNVGIGTVSPSAPLEVASTTGGVIMPRMTTIQKNAISSPTNGEMVYDTDLNKFYGYANGSWVAFH